MDVFQLLETITTGLCLFLIGHTVLTKIFTKTFASRIKFCIVDVVIASLLVIVKIICLVFVVIKGLGILMFLLYVLRLITVLMILLVAILGLKIKVYAYKVEMAKKK